jgi:hypothetical protein
VGRHDAALRRLARAAARERLATGRFLGHLLPLPLCLPVPTP